MIMIIDDLTTEQIRMFVDLAGLIMLSQDEADDVLNSLVSQPDQQTVVARLDASLDTEAA